MATDRELQLEQSLLKFLEPIKNIPYEIVIQSLYSSKVYEFSPDVYENKKILSIMVSALRNVCLAVQKQPIKRSRPNEVGNDMEPFVIEKLNEKGLDAAAPKTKSGKGRSTGFPDVIIHSNPKPIYLEVKTYAPKNRSTSQRSFYLSPSEDPKIYTNGYHLLVGFELQRNGNL